MSSLTIKTNESKGPFLFYLNLLFRYSLFPTGGALTALGAFIALFKGIPKVVVMKRRFPVR